MEEETMTPQGQGMMGANTNREPMELTLSAREVSNNLENLSGEEKQLITQLNIPQFRNFMSKVFGQGFGMIMQEAIPEPQAAQPQPQVSQPSESTPPMTGEGVMQPPVTA